MARRSTYNNWPKAKQGEKLLGNFVDAGIKIGKAAAQGAKESKRQSQRKTNQPTTPPSKEAQACGGLVAVFIFSCFLAFITKNWWLILIINLITIVVFAIYYNLTKPKND